MKVLKNIQFLLEKDSMACMFFSTLTWMLRHTNSYAFTYSILNTHAYTHTHTHMHTYMIRLIQAIGNKATSRTICNWMSFFIFLSILHASYLSISVVCHWPRQTSTRKWTAINRLSVIWKSDLTNKMKHSFFQAAVVSIRLYGCTTWTLTKRLEKKLDGNYTRMLRAILNGSWRQHPTKQQLYGHLPPINKTIQIRQTRHVGHCWRSRDKLISDVLLRTPSHGRTKAGRPAWIYIQQLCEDTGCSPEDLPEVMNDREVWWERVRDIHADGMTRWWWWY